MQLKSLSWKKADEYFKTHDLAIIPVGSVENHGTQSPLGTDYIIPEKLASMIEKEADVLVLPAMPYGVCPHHKSFPGTINIGHDALVMVMRNIAFSLFDHGIRKFVFLNGHGGNDPALDAVSLEIYHKGGIAAVVDWWSLAPQLNKEWLGGHGGGQETSVMMAIHPDWVHLEDSVTIPASNLSENLVCGSINTVKFKGASIKVMRDVRDVVESGWFGPDNPRDASEKWGKEMLQGTAEYLIGFIKEFQKVNLKK